MLTSVAIPEDKVHYHQISILSSMPTETRFYEPGTQLNNTFSALSTAKTWFVQGSPSLPL